MASRKAGKSSRVDSRRKAQGVQNVRQPRAVPDPVQVGQGVRRKGGFRQPLNYIPPWKREWIDRVRRLLLGAPTREGASAARLCGQLSLAIQQMTRVGQFDRAVEELGEAAMDLRMLSEELEKLAIELSDIRSEWNGGNREES